MTFKKLFLIWIIHPLMHQRFVFCFKAAWMRQKRCITKYLSSWTHRPLKTTSFTSAMAAAWPLSELCNLFTSICYATIIGTCTFTAAPWGTELAQDSPCMFGQVPTSNVPQSFCWVLFEQCWFYHFSTYLN